MPRSNLILLGFLAFSEALSTFQSLSITFFPVWIFRLIPRSPHLTTLSDKRGRQNDFKWKTTEMCCFCCFCFFYSAFFYTSHICLFIFPCLFSSLTISWWSDPLESDPRDTRFCISWPLITVGEFSEWTDLTNCFWNQFVKKKVENMHKFYSYLPLWNSIFDVVVGLDFSIQVKLFFSGYVFNRVGVADQNQAKKYIITRSQKKSYQTKISKSN